MSDKIGHNKRKFHENTLDRTLASRLRAPKSSYFFLLLVYGIANVLVPRVASMQGTLHVFGLDVPYTMLPAVITSIANTCVILMVVFFRKTGFFTALVLLVSQFPVLFVRLLVHHLPSTIPGLFTNLFTLVAISIIYSNDVKVAKFQKSLQDQAVTDALTGLPNRFAGSEVVKDLIQKGETFTLVSMDVNNFKGINDTMGFDAGNKVLQEIARRWKDAADDGMTGTLDFITRQGGDEFSLIIRYYSSDEVVKNTICQYAALLANKFTIDGCDYYVNASFGYAEYPTDAKTPDDLYSCADAALYEVKRLNSSNRILRYSEDIANNGRAVELERLIRASLDKDTFFFQLQPQFDIEHQLRGFEALARLKDEAGKPVSPMEFIPVAEKMGLIDKVDLCVFKKAAAFFGDLIAKTGTKASLSINVSVRHLMKNDFLEEVRSVIEYYKIPAEQLEIEITESVLIESVEKALQCINGIKDMGIKIALDDFGTGYSSLSNLNEFPADLLKVDKSFIDKMNTSDSSKQYVEAIISIGHIMNFNVISEGVEDPDQLETLRSIGCDYIQGYIWGKPLSPEKASELVMDGKSA